LLILAWLRLADKFRSADESDISTELREFKLHGQRDVVVFVKLRLDAVKEHVAKVGQPAAEDKAVDVEHLIDVKRANAEVVRDGFDGFNRERVILMISF